jgi:hypothetical protein
MGDYYNNNLYGSGNVSDCTGCQNEYSGFILVNRNTLGP